MAAQHQLQRRLAIAVGVLLIIGLLGARLVPPVALLLSLPFLYMLVRKPVLRRLALGHISRRPRETALVLLGSLLGTAIITGSFIVGDTLRASIVRSAFTQLGPIDEAIPVQSADEQGKAMAAAATLPKSDFDGTLALTGLGITAASTGPAPKGEPHATLVETDFARAHVFGDDPKATGIDGPTPTAGHADVGKDLARRLGIDEGGAIDVYAYGTKATFTVDRVLPRKGIAGWAFNGGSESLTVLVAPGTAEALRAAGPVKGSPPSYFVMVSNTGGVLAGAKRTDAVKFTIARTVGPSVSNMRIIEAKQGLIKGAKEAGAQFTQLFSMIGLFSVLAGILLLVNIFVMLAEERKSELGMLRAVGLRRAGLVGAFSLEGWLYSLGSAVFGTIVGLGVGRVIVIVASGIFSRGLGPQGTLNLEFTATRASALAGFSLGFVISLVTVVGTSLRISRLNVIRAIRDLPEPTVKKRRVFTLVLGWMALVLGLMGTLSAIGNGRAAGILLSPCIAGFGAVAVFRRLPRRAVVSVVAGGLLVWAVFAFALFPSAFRDVQIAVFVIQGVILVGSAVALTSQNQELIGAVVRAVGGGSRNMSLRLGLAYPLARRFRTSMTLAMYALVVYMLATITIFSHLFGAQIDSFTGLISGGFDVVVESNQSNPIPTDALQKQPGVDKVAGLSQVWGEFSSRLSKGYIGWPAAAFDESYIADHAPRLAKRPPQYATDADAFRAVLANPDLFIPTGFFLQRGGGGPPQQLQVGDKVDLRDPQSGRTRTLTVAAVAESGFGNLRPLMSYATLKDLFGDRVVPNVFYVKTHGDPDQVAHAINGAFLANGADANSFHHIIATNLSNQQAFFRLMRGYLALGLVVGIAGLGVVMVRAVRERRREVGVLRSLGFEAKAVRRAFVAESAFVALEGIMVGTVLAVITTWRLVGNADFGAQLHFSIPVVALGVLVLGTIAASLLATAAPAEQAARIRPAVALRIAD